MNSYQHHLIWDLYSDKMHKLIKEHKNASSCKGKEYRDKKLGFVFTMMFDYDRENETFVSMNYQVSGPSFTIALLEGLAELIIGKKVQSIARIRVDDILEQISAYELAMDYEDQDIADFIRYLSRYANLIIDAYYELFEELVGVMYTTPEALSNFQAEGSNLIKDFFQLEKQVQINIIDEVMEKDIRPYVALDDGNVKVKDLTKSGVILIQYEGNCTSCHAAGSTTLSAITSIIQSKIHPELQVLPFLG
ncbi:MAG: hypothetical protein S4CHLAM20_14490 [Chlamydiia bacterium]|nr:hypothetical protein [Chlamydiia bacterium]